jgi:hypothetical protein
MAANRIPCKIPIPHTNMRMVSEKEFGCMIYQALDHLKIIKNPAEVNDAFDVGKFLK